MKTITRVGIVLGALALTACGVSGVPTEKGEHSEMRTASFKKMMPDFSAMGKVVKGEEPYDIEKFKGLSESFLRLSQEPFKHFTSDGADRDGDALPNIWTDTAKFSAEEQKFHAAVQTLNDKAQTGDLAQIKIAYGDVGASCKSCHTEFRRPK